MDGESQLFNEQEVWVELRLIVFAISEVFIISIKGVDQWGVESNLIRFMRVVSLMIHLGDVYTEADCL